MADQSPLYVIKINPQSLDLAGIYTFILKVYQVQAPDNFVEREFSIELIDPCLTAILTIDDTVHLSDPAITLTTFVGYVPH